MECLSTFEMAIAMCVIVDECYVTLCGRCATPFPPHGVSNVSSPISGYFIFTHCPLMVINKQTKKTPMWVDHYCGHSTLITTVHPEALTGFNHTAMCWFAVVTECCLIKLFFFFPDRVYIFFTPFVFLVSQEPADIVVIFLQVALCQDATKMLMFFFFFMTATDQKQFGCI